MYTVGELRPEYLKLITSAQIIFNHVNDVARSVHNTLAQRPVYEEISKATGVPWQVIGLIHMREGNNHLNQGIRQGLPVDPRFFIHDAIQVISSRQKPDQWDIAGILWFCESFNGFGPRHHGIHTGYLWAGTSFYWRGKYDRDGHWNPTLVDEQVGIATALLMMKSQGIVQF